MSQFSNLVLYMQSGLYANKLCTNYLWKIKEDWYACNTFSIIKISNFDIMKYKNYMINRIKKQKALEDNIPFVFEMIKENSIVAPVLINNEFPRKNGIISKYANFDAFDSEIKVSLQIMSEIYEVFKVTKEKYEQEIMYFVGETFDESFISPITEILKDGNDKVIKIKTNLVNKWDNYLTTQSHFNSIMYGVRACNKNNTIIIQSKPLHDNIYELNDINGNGFMWIRSVSV